MKKILVTLYFLFVFAAYSLHQYLSISSTSKYVATNTPAPITSTQPVVPDKKTVVKKNLYSDGTFTGSVANAYYGNIQVAVVISNGKIADVQFLQYPNDRNTSIRINTAAMPILKSEAISAQSNNVDIVSGATDSSQAFIQSLGNALAQAKN